MAYLEMLPFYLIPLLVTYASASCSELVHSECDLRATSDLVLLAIQLPSQLNCRKLCEAIGEGCKFFTFEQESFHQNCQLYRQPMSFIIDHRCNIIGGSKETRSGCDYDALEKDVVVEAQCQYEGVVEEEIKTNSWEHCQQFCATLTQCRAWQFFKEEQICHILGSSQKKCLVNMGAYAPYTQCEPAVTVAKLDFGTPAVNVQDGFQKLGLPDQNNGIFTGTFSFLDSTCSIKVSGWNNVRGNYRAVGVSNDFAYLSNLLRSSFLRNSYGTMTVEIEGLSPYTGYTIKTYHHSTDFPNRENNYFTLQWQGNSEKQLRQSADGENPKPPLTHQEVVMSNNEGKITLTMKGRNGNQGHMDLNGLELRLTETYCFQENTVSMGASGGGNKNVDPSCSSAESCQLQCQAEPECQWFNFIPYGTPKGCWLMTKDKTGNTSMSSTAGWITGPQYCEPPRGLPSSCSALSHSECDMSNCNTLLALQVDSSFNCQAMCEAVGEGCKFFTFEKNSYHENCQLYTIGMANFTDTCNVLGGVSGGSDTHGIYSEWSFQCEDHSYMPYGGMRSGDAVEGQCQYAVVEERMAVLSWGSCQSLADNGNWQGWKYFKEEKKCHLLASKDKNCQVKLGVADPYRKCSGAVRGGAPPAAAAAGYGQSVGGASQSNSRLPSSYYYFSGLV